MKKCSVCSAEKALDNFHRNKNSKDGHVNRCKECVSAYKSGWYKANSESVKASAKKYRKENRDRIRETEKRWVEKNADRVRENKRNWHKKNSEHVVSKVREWVSANPERAQENGRRWAKDNPDKIRESRRRWKASNQDKVSAAVSRRRAAKQNALVDADISILGLRKRDGDQCAYCDNSLIFGKTNGYEPLKATIDHVLPLSLGGEHSWDNVVLACSACNSSKGNRLLSEWRPHVLV
jgi:5-methylcytosine-specific restriction endonuclease McrA